MKIFGSIFLALCLLSLETIAMPRSPIFVDVSPSVLAAHFCDDIRSRWECEDTFGCAWHPRGRFCYRNIEESPCEEITSPRVCSNREDCYWSRSANGCVRNGGGEDNVYPWICYRQNNPQQCHAYAGCYWSTTYNHCVGNDEI